MAMYKEWLERGRAGRLSRAQSWCSILNGDVANGSGETVKRYDLWEIPQSEFVLLMTLYAGARDAYEKAVNKETRTSVTIAACDEAFEALVDQMRFMKRRWLISPPRTRTEMDALGLKVPASTRSPRPAPDERPETEAVPSGRGMHRVTAINPLTQNKGKPDSAAGVSFAARVRRQEEPVSRAEDMPSDYQISSSRVFQYGEEDYGKIADYATSYDNGNGKRGPWSNVRSLIISG